MRCLWQVQVDAPATDAWSGGADQAQRGAESYMGRNGNAKRASRHDKGGRFSWLLPALAQLRIKLTTPYVFLAIAVAVAAAYLVTRLLAGVLNDRFQNALLDAGRQATDTVVRIERDHLALWRSIAYTQGFAEAVASQDTATALRLAVPLIVNAKLDCLEVLDAEGDPVLAMHRDVTGGLLDYSFTPGSDYSEWDTVRTVLAEGVDEIGDKYADVVQTEWGWVFYTVGPVKLEGQTKGVLLVGTYLDSVASRLDAAALARISIYVGAGTPAATTLSPEEPEILLISESEYQSMLARQEAEEIPRREIDVVGRGYSAVAGAFEARHGADLGVLTVALPSSFVTDAWQPTRQSLVVLFGVATALVLFVGSMVASAIVQRVRSLAAATQRVAAGDLRVNLEHKGYDELAALSQDFNDMVVQLREGRTYRDLLGLAASPEVADRLRKSFREGRLSMEAQLTTATVLFADIRGFTRFAESRDPAYVMHFLNDYLQGLVQIIRQYDGVINRFFGDAAMAFFGVLPESQPAEVGAKNAVLASLAILEYLKTFNEQLEARGEEHLRVGFGVSTGAVVAGAVGSEERLDYTLLGDTVNVAFRLSSMNKEYPAWDLFVSSETYQLLDGEPSIEATPLPNMRIQGRMAPIDIYAIRE